MVARTNRRILFANQALKGSRRNPGLLDEFVLALDVGVQAHEEQPLFGLSTLTVLLLIGAPDAQDAVALADIDLRLAVLTKRVARVGTAYVGTERAAMPLRILGADGEIVIDYASRMIGIAHQRTAVLPAAEHLGGNPLRRRGLIAGFGRNPRRRPSAIVVENVDMLLELANDQE
ncbi:hypothetical protein AJ88_04250 [Mesorhizobium amorphae CCBAU 01583]|nr:hypothetical protein AJ88_04250 [Mesorhizobium amorphae CCBAU 01583]